MTNNEWGVQKGSLSLQDSFMEYVPEGDAINEYENIVLGSQIKSCATSANVINGWNLRVSNRIACFIIQRSFRSRLRKLMKLSFKAHNAKILNILVFVSSAPFSTK